MQLKSLFSSIPALFIFFFMTITGAQETTTTEGNPLAFLPTDKYEFEPTMEGTEIMHDFVIKNKGTAPLKIIKVGTDWGCTAVSYTRDIPPGGEGKVTLKIGTDKRGGLRITKGATIYTDDPKNPQLKVSVSGEIKKFAKISPKTANLRGPVDSPIKTSVTITPELEYPFKITEVNAKNGKYISYNLEEVKKGEELKYILYVENLKKQIGRYHDTLILKTDSEIKPEIQIDVSGNITQKEIVTITPNMVNLKGSVGESITQEVSIVPDKTQPLKILDVRVRKGNNISYRLEEVKKDDRIEYVLHIENRKNEIGRYHDTLTLVTDSKIKPEIPVNVYGNITAEQIATVDPTKAILFGPFSKEVETYVNIVPKDEHPFNVLKTEVQNGENITYDLEKVEESGKVKYLLHVKNLKKDPGHYSDTIILKTDSNIQPEIKIGVSGNIHGGKQQDLRDIFETLSKSRKNENR